MSLLPSRDPKAPGTVWAQKNSCRVGYILYIFPARSLFQRSPSMARSNISNKKTQQGGFVWFIVCMLSLFMDTRGRIIRSFFFIYILFGVILLHQP